MKKFNLNEENPSTEKHKCLAKHVTSNGHAIETSDVKITTQIDDVELRNDVKNIENILIETQQELNDDKMNERKELKFKFAAIVLDRFFLCISSVYAVITFVALVIIIPNVYKS